MSGLRGKGSSSLVAGGEGSSGSPKKKHKKNKHKKHHTYIISDDLEGSTSPTGSSSSFQRPITLKIKLGDKLISSSSTAWVYVCVLIVWPARPIAPTLHPFFYHDEFLFVRGIIKTPHIDWERRGDLAGQTSVYNRTGICTCTVCGSCKIRERGLGE